MAKIKRVDQKAVNNRNRVKKYRNIRRLKRLHEKNIHEQSNKIISENNAVSGNHSGDLTHQNLSNDDIPTEIKNKIRYWTLSHRITRTALNELLSILSFSGFSFLPRDSRTLMCTPISVPIKILSVGKLWYNGIRNCLQNIFDGIQQDIEITLDFNFDGILVANSANAHFWPMLSSIQGK